MKQSSCIELAPLWHRGGGLWKSAVLSDDRVQDLFQAIREQPYVLIVKPNDRKRSPKAPDAFLLAFPANRE